MEREIIEREIDLNQENFEIVSQVDIDVNKVDDTATVTVKRWDGSTKSVEIYDGQDGEKGDKGDTGERGPQGLQGAKGDKGDKGDTGATGATGPQGPKGDKGDPGVTPDLSNYVTNTDYASSSTGGVVKTSNGVASTIDNYGTIYPQTKTYSDYTSGSNNMFIGKGTLENVITGKGLIDGLVMLTYGTSTWNDFMNAYNKNKVVYCNVSGRLAFMAYKSSTNVEFQYYRSVASHTASQQGDQVFVYKLTNNNTWTTETREAYTKVVAGTNMTSSYSNGTLTLNASGGGGSNLSIIDYNATTQSNLTVLQEFYSDYLQGKTMTLYFKNDPNSSSPVISLLPAETDGSTYADFTGLLIPTYGSMDYGVSYKMFLMDRVRLTLSNGQVTNYTISTETVGVFPENSAMIMGLDNDYEYEPQDDYQPATKKYVDDMVGSINTVLATLTTPGGGN